MIYVNRIISPASKNKLAGDYNPGESLFFIKNGAPVEYIVLHQGNPDTAKYDASCSGTWCAVKSLNENDAWGSSKNKENYNNSFIQSKLTTEFNSYSDQTKNAIKTVTIPYNIAYSGSSIRTIDQKMFFLSSDEVGLPHAGDGAKLDYFLSGTSAAANEKRKATGSVLYLNYWTRSPSHGTYPTYYIYAVGVDGEDSTNEKTSPYCSYRYACILNPESLFDSETNIILGD